jgi:glycosyltransferase involved in cell wall biosynthesis
MSTLVSIVVPVYNNANTLFELCARTAITMETNGTAFELLLVDDGSRDASWDRIQELGRQDSRIRGLRLSRNFGQHPALAAGFHNAVGSIIVILDADLEDRPEDIPRIVNRLTPATHIVYTLKSGYQGNWFTRLTSACYHTVHAKLTKTRIPRRIGTMRAFSNDVLKALLQHGETCILYGPLMHTIGFASDYVQIERDDQKHNSSYSFRKRLRIAIDSIISYTDWPYRVLLSFGSVTCIIAILYLATILVEYFLRGRVLDPGITLLIGISTLSLGIGSLSAGILGLYLFRVFQEVLSRPRYLIQGATNSVKIVPDRQF